MQCGGRVSDAIRESADAVNAAEARRVCGIMFSRCPSAALVRSFARTDLGRLRGTSGRTLVFGRRTVPVLHQT